MNYGCAAAIGVVSGLRSMTAPAIVAVAARNQRVDLAHSPVRWLASPRASRIASALAIGEMIADKLSFLPDRVKPVSLASRAAAGALCGYAVFSSRGRRDASLAALAGGTTAVAAAWAGFEYRRRVKMPPLIAALLEDAIAAAAGVWLIRKTCGD